MSAQQQNLLAVVGLWTCWGVVVLAWLGAAIYYQSKAPAEQSRSRFASPLGVSSVITVLAAILIPKKDWAAITAYIPWLRILGLAVLLAATALTLWARLVLGAMWSAAPTVKEEHKLRTGGPYAITRHPIYTGLLGMMLGSLFLAGFGRWIVPIPIYFVLLEIKIHTEERLMLAQFPADYPRYRRQVPQLIPGLRLIGRRQVGSDS